MSSRLVLSSHARSKGFQLELYSLGGRSRVRLDVDSPDLGVEAEGGERPGSAEVLKDIDVLISSVVSSAGETLRVLPTIKQRSVGRDDGRQERERKKAR